MKKLASLTLASILSCSTSIENNLEDNITYSSRRETNYKQLQERGNEIQMLAGQLYWSRLIIIKAVSPVAYC